MLDIARTLMNSKSEVESELDSIADTLNSEAFSNIGLQKPLTDEEGFPLAGIDLHQVRQLRNRFAILTTDHADLLRKIEESIHMIHEHARNTGSVTSGERSALLPFGRVETVAPDSAAEAAGILVGDKVVKFGSLSCVTEAGMKQCYESIPSTLHAIRFDSSLEVRVIRIGRANEVIELNVTPRDGRIGCLIRPI